MDERRECIKTFSLNQAVDMVTLPKVFIVVTIPTHLRVLMDVANIISSSGQYSPVIVYYPSAVFDQDYESCQQSPHEALIWTGNEFLPRGDYLKGDWKIKTNINDRGWIESFWKVWHENSHIKWYISLPNKGIYLAMRKNLKFLPSPSLLAYFYEKIKFIITAIFIPFILIYQLVSYFKSRLFLKQVETANQNLIEKSKKKQGWAQRLFINLFFYEWCLAKPIAHNGSLSFLRRIIKFLSKGLFTGISEQKIFFDNFFQILKNQNPVLTVIPEANLFYDSQFVVHAAHLNKVPVVIVPFTIVNTLEWAEGFFGSQRYWASTGWNRLFAKLFPHWTLVHKGRLLILPPLYILGCECFGMVPKVPWLINSGNVDAIAAESQFMSDYYTRAGIEKSKITVTGAPSDDKLHRLLCNREQMRSELAARCNINLRKKIVLIGLPPNQFGAGKRTGCEFDHHEDLIRFMVEVVLRESHDQCTVLINLHPRFKPHESLCLTEYEVAVVNEPIEHLVPLADVYIAVVSATIRLAISCGIPVVNYDAYQYNYDDYEGLDGVREVKSKEEYQKVINSLINDDSFFAEIQAQQQKTALMYCGLDGKSSVRLLTLVEKLTKNNHGNNI